ncbi:MAG: hypothetical protein HY064_07665 [Bacteroidetes bacterium]|nr:hypothetical protein [Bacteroidota bacterium]
MNHFSPLFILLMLLCVGCSQNQEKNNSNDSLAITATKDSSAGKNRTSQPEFDTIQTSNGLVKRIFFKDGKIENEECLGDARFYKSYYPSGKLACFDSSFDRRICFWNFVTCYDSSGMISSLETNTSLDPLSGNQDEFNRPRVTHDENYTGGKIINSGDTYSNCGECEFDSVGFWKFYIDGKLSRTKKFSSWQKEYIKAGGTLK